MWPHIYLSNILQERAQRDYTCKCKIFYKKITPRRNIIHDICEVHMYIHMHMYIYIIHT